MTTIATSLPSYLSTPLAIALLSASAFSTNWWVDDDGGAGIDFTDIQAAVNAASNGDTIFVYPGNYSGFVLDAGIAIVSAPETPRASVIGPAVVQSVNGAGRAVLAGLRMETLQVLSCSSPVVLDALDIVAPSTAATYDSAVCEVENCSDVRIYESTIDGQSVLADRFHALWAKNSRVEVVRSTLKGAHGFDTGCFGDAGDGGSGLLAEDGSEAFVFWSNSAGGDGGETDSFCEWSDPYGGDGGHGLVAYDTSEIWVAGRMVDLIEGGALGYGDTFPTFTDGAPGHGLSGRGNSIIRHSGVTVSSTQFWSTATEIQPSPDDPSLGVFGTHQAGRQLTFKVNGTPGESAILYLGRHPVIQSLPGHEMDQLCGRQRAYPLGTIPASGVKSFQFNLPHWMPIGFSFFAQAEVSLPGGGSLLTNSTPIVIRRLP